jgi:Flp pilus assembly protein TadG
MTPVARPAPYAAGTGRPGEPSRSEECREPSGTSRRSAAVTVEAGFVISICLMFLFGIYEYGRYVMTLQVVENAAREGARFAVAHTNTATTADVQNTVTQSMAGVNNSLTNVQINVSGLVLIPQNSAQTTGQALPNWTSASYTDGISVSVTANFQPVLPNLLGLGTTIPVNATSVMFSEGN